MTPSARRMTPAISALLMAVVSMNAVTGAATNEQGRSLELSTIVMEFPRDAGGMERPGVTFDHAAHVKALQDQGCRTCHTVGDSGLIPQFAAIEAGGDRDWLIDTYHDTCIGCHNQRHDAGMTSGPITCGECHVRRMPVASMRTGIRFDGSLHGRHAQAFPEKCDPCHHVYDEIRQQLVYEKGAEEACGACHGEADEQATPSLRNASHIDCVGCHLQRIDQQLAAGPVLCVGCHDPEQLRAIKRLDPVPRLLRGQPDSMWIQLQGVAFKSVPFQHLGHETNSSACSDCHHSRLKPCGECHGLVTADDGGGVVLVQAHHMPSSEYSCVGCHSARARSRDCAGCHVQLQQAPSERTCAICHSGPTADVMAAEQAPPLFEPVVIAGLPAISDQFPETVEIDWLVDEYEASKLPHAKIVARLDAIVRGSQLASRFHGDVDTLCAGCHHNSPVGLRPPPCRSCHGSDHGITVDRPELKAAYHRQCVGCHIAMAIEKQGCDDCHAAREIQS